MNKKIVAALSVFVLALVVGKLSVPKNINALTFSKSLSLGSTSPLSISVSRPNGGEILTLGTSFPITWNSSSNIDKVSIGLVRSSGTKEWIAYNIPNTNFLVWTVSNFGVTSPDNRYKIQVIGYQTGVGSTYDYSDGYFTIKSSLPSPTSTPSVTSTPPPRPTKLPLPTSICAPCPVGKMCIDVVCPQVM
jgi:hypothetical protein